MVPRGKALGNSARFSCPTNDSFGHAGDMRLERRLKRRSVTWRGLKDCPRETKALDSCEVVTIVEDDDEAVDSWEEEPNAQGNCPREIKALDSSEVVTIVVDDDEAVDSWEEKPNAQGHSPAIHDSLGCICDMRLERRLKRRLVACMDLKGGETKAFDSSGVIDIVTDDEETIDCLEEKGGGHLNGYDEKTDPRYAMSYRRRRSEGCSYILGSPMDSSATSLVRYEGEADLCLDWKLEIPESSPQ